MSKPMPKPKPKPKPKPEKYPETERTLKPQSAMHNPQPQMAALGIESAQQRYENALSQALKKNQSYPRRAKRRHKEGRVKVSFTIHQSGAVSDVHILNGSGSFILDKAAVKAVKKINGLMPFPKELKKSALSEVISFNYTLN
jgi:TonB family protein